MRFPHVGEQIFEQMDNKDLKKCSEAGKHWNGFISGQKIPWIRMIHKYVNCSEPWPEFLKKSTIKISRNVLKLANIGTVSLVVRKFLGLE